MNIPVCFAVLEPLAADQRALRRAVSSFDARALSGEHHEKFFLRPDRTDVVG